MSHTKFDAAALAAGEPAKIRFYYTTDKLFNSVSLRSTYRANMTKNGEGESQLDDIAISQDEKDIVRDFLADAAYEIAAELFKITEGVNSSVFVDAPVILNGVAGTGDVTDAATAPTTGNVGDVFKVTEDFGTFVVGDKIVITDNDPAVVLAKGDVEATGFEVKDNAAFNQNLIPSLDRKIEACIRYYILREWYASTGMQNDMVLNAQMYKANMIKVKNLTFQLRKPLMS